MRTIQAFDAARGRVFPVEIWHPADNHRAHPLIVVSHSSGGNRRSAAFLGAHLASHGYVVAALDHSELVAPELARRDGETEVERAARTDALIASRVPDVRFLLDHLLSDALVAGCIWGFSPFFNRFLLRGSGLNGMSRTDRRLVRQ